MPNLGGVDNAGDQRVSGFHAVPLCFLDDSPGFRKISFSHHEDVEVGIGQGIPPSARAEKPHFLEGLSQVSLENCQESIGDNMPVGDWKHP